jgi:hypothetical protein
LIISVPVVVAIGAHGALRVRQEEAQVRGEERQSLALTAKAVQIAVENALRDRQISDVRRLLTEMVEQQESIDRIRLFDRHLAPTFASAPLAMADTVPAAMLQRVMTTGLGEDDYERRGAHSYLTYVVPVRGRTGAIEGRWRSCDSPPRRIARSAKRSSTSSSASACCSSSSSG